MKNPTATGIPFHDILLIEDDPVLRGILSQILETAGYTVQTVADGRMALSHLASHLPRLIITDIFMPEADGFEVLARLRCMWPPLPIIAMSGGDVSDIDVTLKTAGHLGAAHILAKPFPLQTLLAAVHAAIGLPR
jgi:CheY-like chemotaxis protein